MSKKILEIWNRAKSIDSDSELQLGPYSARHLLKDSKHFGFFISRYKFAGKMIGEERTKSVLDVGCGEGIGSLVLTQFAKSVTGIDFDENTIKWAKNNLERTDLNSHCKDLFSATSINEKYDAVGFP